jgi:hypothetical protein
MKEHQNAVSRVLQITEKIHEQAKAIRTKMENNDAEQLETLQLLFDKREIVIQELDTYMQQEGFQWTEGDRKVINQLNEYELILKPLMDGLHRSFLTQMNQISQTKQVTQKYFGAYQNMKTNGSFFDKRK